MAATDGGVGTLDVLLTCSIEGCNREHAAKGWCLMHYKRWRRRGTTDTLVRTVNTSECSIDGCEQTQLARGWCSKHWTRWKKTGDPLGLHHPTYGMTTEDRLNHYTDKTGDCWLWEGYLNKKGYGFMHNNGGPQGVHRVAYELWVGPIADGMEIDHLCLTQNCVNPDHLEQVTPDENKRRRWHGL